MIIWIAIFPLVTLGLFAIESFAANWHPVLRALILTVVVVPVAAYIVVPRLVRIYGKARAAYRQDIVSLPRH